MAAGYFAPAYPSTGEHEARMHGVDWSLLSFRDLFRPTSKRFVSKLPCSSATMPGDTELVIHAK